MGNIINSEKNEKSNINSEYNLFNYFYLKLKLKNVGTSTSQRKFID